jgi:hypothetical protein
MLKHYSWVPNLEPFILSDVLGDVSVPESEPLPESSGDPHLRSAKEVARYRVDASGGPIGDITDFVIDDETWEILKLVVSAESAPDNRRVLVHTRWVMEVSWEHRRVQLSLRAKHSETVEFLT